MTVRNRLPTITDVAQLAGVSIATVSRVRTAARVLASRKTNTIGLLFSEIRGAFFAHLLHGIEPQLRAAGYQLLIYSTQSDHPTKRKPLGEHNTDGLLVFTASLEKEELRRLNKINFPLVLMHQTPTDGVSVVIAKRLSRMEYGLILILLLLVSLMKSRLLLRCSNYLWMRLNLTRFFQVTMMPPSAYTARSKWQTASLLTM